MKFTFTDQSSTYDTAIAALGIPGNTYTVSHISSMSIGTGNNTIRLALSLQIAYTVDGGGAVTKNVFDKTLTYQAGGSSTDIALTAGTHTVQWIRTGGTPKGTVTIDGVAQAPFGVWNWTGSIPAFTPTVDHLLKFKAQFGQPVGPITVHPAFEFTEVLLEEK